MFTTFNPFNGTPLSELHTASEREIDLAVAAARTAFESGRWPRMPASERAAYLFEFADCLESRLGEVADLESADTGLPLYFTRNGHVPRAVSHFRYFAEEASRIRGETFPLDSAYINFTLREAIGVVAIIAPWNAPLAVASMHLAAALACGNSCILKPSELAPLTANVLAEISLEVCMPPGVINVVQGPANPSGEALVAHKGVDMVSFTGSSEGGRRVMSLASSTLKRMTCELGGKSPSLVFADSDLDSAINGNILSMFANNGAVCMAASRILVERSIYKTFLTEFAARASQIRIGDPLDEQTELGPLISESHCNSVLKCVREAIEGGARIETGGQLVTPSPSKTLMRPTVLSYVSPNMAIFKDELFAPVSVVVPFDSTEHAIELANDSSFGLAAYVWTEDSRRALYVARKLRSGVVAINSPIVRDISVPFGGTKQSGFGRAGGTYSIDAYTTTKTICLPVKDLPLPQMGMGRNPNN